MILKITGPTLMTEAMNSTGRASREEAIFVVSHISLKPGKQVLLSDLQTDLASLRTLPSEHLIPNLRTCTIRTPMIMGLRRRTGRTGSAVVLAKATYADFRFFADLTGRWNLNEAKKIAEKPFLLSD